MLLNLLRVEELNPEYMLERSFYQFQHRAAVPELEKSVYRFYECSTRYECDGYMFSVVSSECVCLVWKSAGGG